ncbi:ornithine cyclodeaminase family protein [Halovivax sp.]|uniref:ornithine cyclodeaminase family protein n=1 Tax=Halovivax sp. TaxID=1935978 RepID=UPI0025BFD569|nr:ornithine cyclodeaminase family protein [Halovivax sp.]
MVRVLSDADVADVLELESLLPVVADAFRADYRDEVTRPDRPHYPIGAGLDADESDDPGGSGLDADGSNEPLGTGLCMPAYVHGSAYAATKLVTVFEDNPDRGLPTVSARIELTDARTGRPVAYLAGTRITNARTGCIGGLAARELAVDGSIRLAILGAGTQARWQARAIRAAVGGRLESIRVYSPSDSREKCAAELTEELDVPAAAVGSPREAISDATVVVTATTSREPVFPGDALEEGALVIAVGAYTPEMRELDADAIERAATVFADVPDEAGETGDLRPFSDLEPVPFGAVLAGESGRSSADDVLVLASVGTAVLDAASSEHVVERATERDAGSEFAL